MGSIRYANADCIVRWGHQTLRLTPGAAWDADDPFVKSRPDLFTDTPAVVNRSGPVVETATRRPGERRGAPRA